MVRHGRSRARRRAARGIEVAALAVAMAGLFMPEPLAGEATGLTLRSPLPSPGRHLEERPPERRDETFDILAAGDLLIHSQIYRLASEQAGHAGTYDFRPFLAEVRAVVRRADLALCHVETPMGPGPPASYPRFNTPVELAAAIRWAGFDVCDTASNHTLDRGQDGVDSTIEALEDEGVAHTGSATSASEARRILIVEVHGVRIAFLAYSYSTNGIPPPHPWSVNVISRSRVEADADRARRHGADLVIVNLHWGTEYVHEPNDQQDSLAADLLRPGVVDVIVGQHAHVVQPIRRVHGRFVVYGEGNLISGMSQPDRRDGLLALIHVRTGSAGPRITGVGYVPLWVRHPDHVVLPVGRTLERLDARGEGGGGLAGELRDSYARTVAHVGMGRGIAPVPAVLPGAG